MREPIEGTSPTKLALALGGGLLALVALLSALAPHEMPVSEEQFTDLIEAGDITIIEVEGPLLFATSAGGGGSENRPVLVDRRRPPSAEEISRWKVSGILVSERRATGSDLRDTTWLLTIVALLLFGVWQLISQARRHRQDGSPREHIERAESELRDGKISREEFEKRVSAYSVEL
ncbi:MAG: hypothetical protein VX733_05965 [Candidatus Latescibacterota bacterium]|nr:hypothetical protein [Candidatus Latescibacterota bacterium]